jgi:hypothetical protein
MWFRRSKNADTGGFVYRECGGGYVETRTSDGHRAIVRDAPESKRFFEADQKGDVRWGKSAKKSKNKNTDEGLAARLHTPEVLEAVNSLPESVKDALSELSEEEFAATMSMMRIILDSVLGIDVDTPIDDAGAGGDMTDAGDAATGDTPTTRAATYHDAQTWDDGDDDDDTVPPPPNIDDFIKERDEQQRLQRDPMAQRQAIANCTQRTVATLARRITPASPSVRFSSAPIPTDPTLLDKAIKRAESLAKKN